MESSTKENKKSLLLTQDENDFIFSILKPKCQSLATTVVQMFSTSDRTGAEWNYDRTGVLCLIRDANRRSYFFQLLCPEEGKLAWEHEVYTNLDYLQRRLYLYSFEAEDCIVGFNFACEDEASQLYSVLLEKLIRKRERMQRRPSRRGAATREVTEVQEEPVTRLVEPIKEKQRFTLRRKKKNVNPPSISSPRNFQHLSHLGWDHERGFSSTVIDPTVKNEILVTKDNVEDINEFIESDGGLNRAKRELKKPPSSEESSLHLNKTPGSPRRSRGRLPVNEDNMSPLPPTPKPRRNDVIQNDIPASKDNLDETYEFIEGDGGFPPAKTDDPNKAPTPYSMEPPGSPRRAPLLPLPTDGNNVPPIPKPRKI